MPKASLFYFFELKISELIQVLAGNLIKDYDPDKDNTFILLLNKESGEFEYINLDRGDKCFETVDKLEEEKETFFFYDHFDPHCYAYFKWNSISQTKMEELRGELFQDSDFTHIKTKEKGRYRESGSVMLG